jgi:hypothetical protein
MAESTLAPPAAQPVTATVVENQTAKRLIVTDGSEEFVLAPFERRTVEEADYDRFQLKRFVARGMASEVMPFTPRSDEAIIQVIIAAFFAYLMGGAFVNDYLQRVKPTPDPNNLLQRIGFFLMEYYWGIAAGVAIALVVIVIAVVYKRRSDLPRLVVQWITLLATAVLTFGVPSFIVYRFGGGRELLANGTATATAIVGRGLQLLVIGIGSLLPALMYYLFDRQKLGTLRSRLEQQLLRLDPAAQNLRDVRAKYDQQLNELYGAATATDERLARVTRWPILIATVLTMAGWMLTLPLLQKINQDDVLVYLTPPPNTLVFAFLGAYVFTLYSILRRYVRGDLKPKAYSSISVRIFVVMILAWLIEIVLPTAGTSANGFAVLEKSTPVAFAFFIGIIPETGLTWIQELIRKRIGIFALQIEERHPLTDIEGIDLYDRARLLDEGITNVESLAHCDLIDLILETRIPVPRIVDWMDQAILYLHIATPYAATAVQRKKRQNLHPQEQEKSDEPEADTEAADTQIVSLRRTLRNYGIRTATDLVAAYNGAQNRNQQTDKFFQELRGKFPATSIEPVQVLLDSMADDEWFAYIKHWRQNRITEEYRIQIQPQQLIAARQTLVRGQSAGV